MPRRATSAAACRSHSPPTNGPRRRRSRRSRPARWPGRSAHQGRNRPGGAQHPPIWGQRGASATATAPSRPPTVSAPAARGRRRPRRRGRCRGTAPSGVRPRRQQSGGRCLSPAAPPAQLRPYSASRLSRQGRPAASRRGGGHNLKAKLSQFKGDILRTGSRVRDILHPGSRRPALSAWMCAAAPEEPGDGGVSASIPRSPLPPPPPSSSAGGAAVDTGSRRVGNLIRGSATVGARTRCGVARLPRAPRRWRGKGRTGVQARERVAMDDLVTYPSLSLCLRSPGAALPLLPCFDLPAFPYRFLDF
jgi:hypothetical protein